MTQAQILSSNRDVRAAMDQYGYAEDDEKVARALRIVRSTHYFAAGEMLTSKKFFQQSMIDGVGSNYAFPQNETAVDIIGLKIIHGCRFASTPVDIQNEIQQQFELNSDFSLTYQRRQDRIAGSVSEFVPHMFVNNGGALVAVDKPNTNLNNGFFILPTPLQIAAKSSPEWNLTIPSGFALGAAKNTGADADPVIPGQAGKTAFIMLQLIIEEKFVAQG